MGVISLGEDYLPALVQALIAHRTDGSFCDVEVTVDSHVIYAHKAILAACSPFFRTMFPSDFREGNQVVTETDLTEALGDHETAERVITSFYTGKLSINQDNMCSTYAVCSYLVCDQARAMCLEYMASHLTVDTALAVWCVTDNPHDMKGSLHVDATEILLNRFHDYIIYQDDALEYLVDTQLDALIDAGLFKHCSPKQKLTFLVKWLASHGPEKSDTFLKCLPRLSLPRVPDPSEALAVIGYTIGAGGFDGKSKAVVMETVKKCISMDTPANSNSRKASVVSIPHSELPACWEPEDNWCLNVLSHHLPNVPLVGTSEDSIIALSPRYITVEDDPEEDDEDEEPVGITEYKSSNSVGIKQQLDVELKICAYLLKSKIWLDLGNASIPTDDNGIRIDVCKFEMIVCGGFLYLHNNGIDLYRLSLDSKQWEIMQPTYTEEAKVLGIFATDVGGTLFFIIVRDLETKQAFFDGLQRLKIKWDIQTLVSLWMVDSEDDSLNEVLTCPEELIPENGVTFGPCFNQDGLIYLRLKTDAMSIERHGCLKFDPTTSEVTFEPFVTGRSESGAWGFMKNYRPPAMDPSLTMTKGDWLYLFSKEKGVSQRMKQENSQWHLEKESVTFPDEFYQERTHAFNVTLRQSLPKCVDVPLGSSLFRFVNSDHRNARGKLLEVNITKPYIIEEHTPPSCDCVIGASYAAFPVKNVAPLQMARFEYVEVDERRPIEPDRESMYTKSHAELPRS